MKHLLLLSIYTIGLPSLIIAQSLLWEVSGNGLEHSSYLYGTFHSMDSRVYEFGDSVMAKFDEAHTLMVEVDATKEELDMASAMEMAMMKDQTLEDLLSEEDFAFVKSRVMEVMGFNGLFFNNMKPLFTTMLALQLEARQEMPEMLDNYFLTEAKERNKKVVALEKTENVVAALDKWSVQEQADLLVKFFRNYEEQIAEMESLIEMYRSQDLQAMLTYYESNEDYSGEFDRELVVKRNKQFLESIRPLLKKESVFCAVGALHLPGETGLIATLRKEGYRVTPMPSPYIPRMRQLEDYEAWYIYQDSLPLVMRFPDDPYVQEDQLYLGESRSIPASVYFYEDSTREMTYLATVGSVSGQQVTPEDIARGMKEQQGWKMISMTEIEHHDLDAIEVEFNVQAGLNYYAIITMKDDVAYVIAVQAPKPMIYSNLTDYFIEGVEFTSQPTYPGLEITGYNDLIIAISAEGDTIFDNDPSRRIKLELTALGDDEFQDITMLETDDYITFDLPYGAHYQLHYSCEGYEDKWIRIDISDVPEDSEFYRHGSVFEYRVNLRKSGTAKDEVQHIQVRYEDSIGDFSISTGPWD